MDTITGRAPHRLITTQGDHKVMVCRISGHRCSTLSSMASCHRFCSAMASLRSTTCRCASSACRHAFAVRRSACIAEPVHAEATTPDGAGYPGNGWRRETLRRMHEHSEMCSHRCDDDRLQLVHTRPLSGGGGPRMVWALTTAPGRQHGAAVLR